MHPYRPFILTLLLIAPIAVLADEPKGSRGGGPGGGGAGIRGGDNDGRGDGRNEGRGGGGGGFGGRRPGSSDWSDEDQDKWNKVKDGFAKFSEENTPNFAKFGLKNFDDAVKGGSWFHRRMAKRYVELVDLQKSDRALYDIKVALVRVEDAEFDLMRQIWEAKRANDQAKVDDLKQELKGKARDYVKARLDEREHRIKLLEASITKEREQLVEDRQNIEALADAHQKDLEKPRQHRGGGGPGRPGGGTGAGASTNPGTPPLAAPKNDR